jgi:hypothetical protein
VKFISNIEKIKMLTDSLIDRDSARVKILNLFDKFCSDFPIKINAWIVDEKNNIVSKNGKEISSPDGKLQLSEIFSDKARAKNIKMHNFARSGSPVTYIINDGNTVFLTKLIPSGGKQPVIFGISVDITSFSNAIDALDVHCDDSENNNCELLHKIKNDNLYKIIKEQGLDNE